MLTRQKGLNGSETSLRARTLPARVNSTPQTTPDIMLAVSRFSSSTLSSLGTVDWRKSPAIVSAFRNMAETATRLIRMQKTAKPAVFSSEDLVQFIVLVQLSISI